MHKCAVVNILLLCFIYYVLGTNDRNCSIPFKHIPIRTYFNEDLFEGKWYTQLQTTYTWGDHEWVSGVNNIQHVGYGIYNITHIAYSKFDQECKIISAPNMAKDNETTGYFHDYQLTPYHLLVVFTSYEYAVVAMCFALDDNEVCPHSKTKYMVWSRSIDYPPEHVLYKVATFIETTLYVDFKDFKELDQGLCSLTKRENEDMKTVDEFRLPVRPSLQTIDKGVTSFYVTWIPPRDSTVTIQGYRVGIGRHFDQIQTRDVKNDIVSHTFDKLESNTEYFIKISAFNSQGEGKAIYKRTRTKMDKCNAVVAQENIDEKRLSGVWYVLAMRMTPSLYGISSYDSSTSIMGLRRDGCIFAASNTRLSGLDACVELSSVSQRTAKPGVYKSRMGNEEFSLKIIYTDYNYMISYFCMTGDTGDERCNKDYEIIEIFSKTNSTMSEKDKTYLYSMVEKQLCISASDMTELTIGLCDAPSFEDGNCDLNNYIVQENFNLKNFLGVWHLTAETDFLGNDQIFDSLTLHFSQDANGVIHVAYAGKRNGSCVHVTDSVYREVIPGFYRHHDKSRDSYIKIHFTDYTNAIVEFCTDTSHEYQCQRNKQKVQIWSRNPSTMDNTTYINLYTKAMAYFRVLPHEMHYVAPGGCQLSVASISDKQCGFEYTDVHSPLDITKFSGLWYTHISTQYWVETALDSITRRVAFDQDGNMHLAMTAVINNGCFGFNMKTTEIKPGYYKHKGRVPTYLKIVYTDYKYAIVDMCRGNSSDTCAQRQLEIWSRYKDSISSLNNVILKDLVFGTTCISSNDLYLLRIGQCQDPTHTANSMCGADRLKVQEQFNVNQFLGTWFTRFSTNFVWKHETLIHLKRTFSYDENNILHMKISGRSSSRCLYHNDIKCKEISPGVFLVPRTDENGQDKSGYFTIHYTNYRYAILYFCFIGSFEKGCNKTNEQVEIVSRDQAKIPEQFLLMIEVMLENNMCVLRNDMTQTSPVDCFTRGIPYYGTKNYTKSGKSCQRWDSNYPHSHGYHNEILALDNYCRSYNWSSPWCYTQDPNTSWEHCMVPVCDDDCVPNIPHITDDCFFSGIPYVGKINRTISGRLCQRWKSNTPHSHDYHNADFALNNYCRSYDYPTPWCYTQDPNTRWENCTVPICTDCYTPGQSYFGITNHTKSGKVCQRWDADYPHRQGYHIEDLAIDNYCRSYDYPTPWCYTLDPKTRWENCTVPICNSKCGADRLKVQEQFKLNQFLGTWFTRFSTNFVWKHETLIHLKRTFSYDENNILHMMISGRSSSRCLYHNDIKCKEISPGVFLVPRTDENGQDKSGYFTIHYTNYRHAILYFCLIGSFEKGCNKTNEQVEIVSRDQAKIPEQFLLMIEVMLEKNMCVLKNDMTQTSPVDCFTRGIPYYGTKNYTKSGKSCQRWDSNYPHSHGYHNEILALDNYCRSYNWSSPWCYTQDPNTSWEHCMVPVCDDDCVPNIPHITDDCFISGIPYVGKINRTISGRLCQRWKSNTPHSHDYHNADFALNNYCRSYDYPTPWCYTQDPNTRWENCTVPICTDCYTPGQPYFGITKHTKSGKVCQRWDADYPHRQGYHKEDLAIDNYCRSYDYPTPWCYTLDPKTRWENCTVPICTAPNPVMHVSGDKGSTRWSLGNFFRGLLNV